MTTGTFMDKLRTFLGLKQEPPRNDFRNPIWNSDDEDDGDELYTRQNLNIYSDPQDLHQELAKQMHDMFKSFGNIFGDMKSFLHDDNDHVDAFTMMTDQTPEEPENFNSNNIRNYYLKPGYHNRRHEHPNEDVDLDGKISSHEISGLLKHKDGGHNTGQIIPFHGVVTPFNGNLVPGRSFCQTIITTSIAKPDGTVETKRIVKKGNEVIEEITTTDSRDSLQPGLNSFPNNNIDFNRLMSDLSSLFRNFY